METLEYTTMDKSTWGEGEWNSEVDKKQWRGLGLTVLQCDDKEF